MISCRRVTSGAILNTGHLLFAIYIAPSRHLHIENTLYKQNMNAMSFAERIL